MNEQTVELEDVTIEAETDLALRCNIGDRSTGFQRALCMRTRKFQVRAIQGQSYSCDGLLRKKGWCDAHSARPTDVSLTTEAIDDKELYSFTIIVLRPIHNRMPR